MSSIVDPKRRSEIVRDVVAQAKKYETNETPKEDTKETFLSRVPDIFTFPQYGYSRIVSDIYHDMTGPTLKKEKRGKRKKKKGSISEGNLNISPDEFKALVSVGVYNRIVENKSKDMSLLSEMFSLMRMLNFEISNDKRICDYVGPKDVTTDMGGYAFQLDQEVCACARHENIIKKGTVHVLCAKQDNASPGTISEIMGVAILEKRNDNDTESADGDKTLSIKDICPITRRMNDEVYQEILPHLCPNHIDDLVLIECIPYNEYISQRRDMLVDEILNSYKGSCFYLDTCGKSDEITVKEIINEIDYYSEIIFNKLFPKKDKYTNYHG